MHLDLLPTMNGWFVVFVVFGFLVGVASLIVTPIVASEKSRIGTIVGAFIFVAAAVVFTIGVLGAINLSDNNGPHNRESLQSQAKDVYGLQLSRNQTDALLDGADHENPDVQEYGKTLLNRGDGKVQKVQLVHINDTWLIIDAGTRSELPHE
jgi:uncharacterized membrane protein (DUF485 family)